MKSRTKTPILIAGGGPVGLVAAFALARQGVHVFEAENRVNDAPRAGTIHAATLEILAELGMIDDVIKNGLVEPLFSVWERRSDQIIAEFDYNMLKDDAPYPFVVQYEQHKLADLAIERLRTCPHATIEFSTRVTALAQDANDVEIAVQTADGVRKVAGSYLIGADGGGSNILESVRT